MLSLTAIDRYDSLRQFLFRSSATQMFFYISHFYPSDVRIIEQYTYRHIKFCNKIRNPESGNGNGITETERETERETEYGIKYQ